MKTYIQIIAKNSRAKPASGAPWVRKWSDLPIRENLVITWPYTDWPPARQRDRPSAPQAYQCLLSHILASLGAHRLHINVVINWQLSKQGIRCPVSPGLIAGSGVDPSRSSIFFVVIRWRVTSFQMIAGSFFLIHMKYVVFRSLWPSTINILISNWPWTRKFSQLLKNASREDRCFSLFSP